MFNDPGQIKVFGEIEQNMNYYNVKFEPLVNDTNINATRRKHDSKQSHEVLDMTPNNLYEDTKLIQERIKANA